MLSPKKYQSYIKELAIEDLKLDVQNTSKGMATLESLEYAEEILIKLKYNIRMDIRGIRINHLEKTKEIDQSPLKKRWFKSRKPSNKLKQKKELSKKRDTTIAAYEEVIGLIDEYLLQLEEAKVYVKNSIKNSF